ncbi:energy-coupling factor transporter transmembrane component T [Microbacterium sp. APC 3898]|uniref:Energy-coupling factor transporter transmembrane component T n=1 Tax=Planococcus notacanthi TaxID=3035188 RepID=A0ABT7ZHR2_9BACL|nr:MULTISPECIES: energy-coupling factor transporter transmembrane component T [Terrabacteria group]MDN3426448.1 energy-coupling factor transporter transmembrane component T [Planococcus sp. APC 4016]MDN3498143.1 energy-coupling factor transporter transmembrane component T [Microbacterium sp. APC 3898]
MRNLLHDMNPSVKFVLVTVSMLALAFFFNPWTPLLFWLGIVLLQLMMSRTKWKLWLLFMLPFSIGAFGYLWTTVVFGADTGGTVIWSFAGIDVTDEQWARALSLAFRVMAFSTLSLLFAFTTDPVKFIMSLMQQLKLSPKMAYGVMVGYQFLPVMKDEFTQIQQAQRLRGAEMKKYSWQHLLEMRRILIPMLAGAVRKAERSAFAMEARGFTGEPRSAYYRPVRIGRTDLWMSGIFMVILLASCIGGSWLS